jgi:ectoine hydroxylase-related dioxygenase (phytanoyl-CoA dioxygenase family)
MSIIDISQFQVDGYQIFKNVIPQDVIISCRTFLSNKIVETLGPAKAEINCPSDNELIEYIKRIVNGNDELKLESLSKATRDALSGHFSLNVRLSSILLDVACSDGLLNILRKILDSQNIYMHMPPTSRYVLPGNIYAGVPPHQDISYNKHLSDFVTIWVPFVDIDDECGGVTIFQGSGNAREFIVDQITSKFWLDGVPTDGLKAFKCYMKPGDILALNKFIIHGSSPNNSNRTRISTDFRFFGVGASSSKHYLDMVSKVLVEPNK